MLLNGEKPTKELFENSLVNSQFLVGIDGGTNWLVENDFKPNLVLGDLDSVLKQTLEKCNFAKIIKTQNQDLTDFEKGLNYLIEKYTFQEIEVWGATGKRIDHFLANLATLKKLAKNTKITFCDNFSESVLIFENSELTGKIGQQVSLIPIFEAKKVSLKGFKFETEKMDLEFGKRISSSNQFAKTTATVNLESGCLFVTKIRVGKE